jgi:NADH-quinone oxidoreductase subunit N
MNAAPAIVAVIGGLAAAALLRGLDRGGGTLLAQVTTLVALLPLAVIATGVATGSPVAPLLASGLAIAILARRRGDLLHGECALKLLWVLGSALALSWAGRALIVVATGTPYVVEQWAVMKIEVDPAFLWRTGLPLSLLLGLVLLGGAPFHFWAADVFQGARPGLAPLAVAALQVSGAGWLNLRLAGIGSYPRAAELAAPLLGAAALVGLLVGAVTLAAQRRPERRIGTLASINGALTVALIAARGAEGAGPELRAWAVHLVLALTGAGALSRFVPVSGGPAGAPVLFRRHPWSGLAGLYALFSLAGVPGTPGAWVWLAVGRALAASGHTWLLIAAAVAWLVVFSVVVRELRAAFGVRVKTAPPEAPVPRLARAALWVSAAGLVGLMLARG